VPIMWRVARWSPVILVGAWLYLVSVMLRARGGLRALRRLLPPFEAGVVVWGLATAFCLFTSDRQYDYRQQALLPALAILSALFIFDGSRRRAADAEQGRGAAGPLYSFFLWAVLLLPLMVVLKAPVTRWILASTARLPIGENAGLDLCTAGVPFVAAWLGLLAVLARWGMPGVRLAQAVVAPPARVVVAVLLVFELAVIGRYFLHPEMSLVGRQGELAHYVADGDIVAGKMAATLFHPLPVHTVRRVAPDASPDVFDFDAVWHRYRPRYVLATRRLNYAPYQPYAALARSLADKGYAEVFHFDVGQRRDDVPRFEFALYRAPGSAGADAGGPHG